MEKNKEVAHTAIPEEASITSLSQPPIRLRGSSSSQLPLRPNTHPNGGGEPPPPPPPPPAVSTPDLALQISFCLPAELNDAIVSAVRQAIDPNADVRTACVSGTQHIGIWLRPFVNEQDNQARDRGLQRLSLLSAGETIACFVNSALIRRKAMEGWDAPPKRLNGDGAPDANGPIHLTGFTVNFESPNKIVTRINGFDERPWPDVSFQLVITDTLSLSAGQLHCESQRHLDVDTSWLNFLTGLFLIVLPPLGIVFLVERIIVGSAGAPSAGASIGSSTAALIPQEILIPGGLKVVASYSRLSVSEGGIFTGGTFLVVPRSPEVTIAGLSQFSVVEGPTSVIRSYSLHTEDLLPPLHITWSGDGTALKPSAETTGFRFNLTGVHAGQVLTRHITVRVTDADNLTGSADLTVRIHVTPEDGNLPPICRIKPWLPQCREPLARALQLRRQEQPIQKV